VVLIVVTIIVVKPPLNEIIGCYFNKHANDIRNYYIEYGKHPLSVPSLGTLGGFFVLGLVV
jgi:hypothetical protein